jgi:hypothetical protein
MRNVTEFTSPIAANGPESPFKAIEMKAFKILLNPVEMDK